MTDTHDNSVVNGEVSPIQALSGSIFKEEKNGAEYARWSRYEKGQDGEYKRIFTNLGKIIDQEKGIYKSKGNYFTFSLEKGFGKAPEWYNNQIIENVREHLTLEFGNIWMVDQMFRQTGLVSVLDDLIPDARDTLKALVSFRTLEEKAYCYANIWYASSYARVLYPNAKLESQRISEFHELLGQEEYYRKFFRSYLNIVGKLGNNNYEKAFPILIDSTGLQNDIKTHITAQNNHNGVVNNEIRLIYVLDKVTKLPIYFRYVAGNIIDKFTLINTINHLMSYGIEIELVIMDAGYYSSNNLSQLINSNIPFITRMVKNRNEYKELMAKYGANLRDRGNALTYGNRSFYGKKVPITLYDRQLFAYIMLDINEEKEDESKIIQKYVNDENKAVLINKHVELAGKFILLSTTDYSIDDILPLYYTK